VKTKQKTKKNKREIEHTDDQHGIVWCW
jgi:hypothetical protein